MPERLSLIRNLLLQSLYHFSDEYDLRKIFEASNKKKTLPEHFTVHKYIIYNIGNRDNFRV